MFMPQDTRLRKITVELPVEEAYHLTNQLQHGQLTLIMRTFIIALAQSIEKHGKIPLYLWLEGEEDLTVPPMEHSDDK